VRAMFFGTPAIAVPALRALHACDKVTAVVCQPDRARGRGLELSAPAVKVAAEELGLEVLQPEKLKDGVLASYMLEQKLDLAVVMAYGRILPQGVLTAPRLGCVNLHASLLPEYRGAAPIQRCLMDGRTETGLCLMQMDEGLDTGDVLSVRRLPIGDEETYQELADRLAEFGADMVTLDLPRLLRGELEPKAQDPARATYAPPLSAADFVLDFAQPALTLKNRIRALAPKPGAAAFIERAGTEPRRLRILQARALPVTLGPLAPGEVQTLGDRILVGTGGELLEILLAQVEGRKVLGAADLARGRALRSGDRLVGSAL
jgi:methionyl-tRNA formyltransferase